MKRSFLLLAGLTMSVLAAGGAWAADLQEEALPESREAAAGRKTVERQIPDRNSAVVSDETFLRNRVSDLERRMTQLQEEINFMEERTKSLDRRIDDLRQRH